MADHDIMRGSAAWERLNNGIPPEITDGPTRRILHDYAAITTVLTNTVNELLDERDRMHTRIDRRGEDINALGSSCSERHDELVKRLYDSETGTVPKLAQKSDVNRLTVMLWGILVSVTTAAVMLALNLVAKGGS